LFGRKQSFRNRVDDIQSYRLASKPLTFRGRRFSTPLNNDHYFALSSGYQLIIDLFADLLLLTSMLADPQGVAALAILVSLSRVTAARTAEAPRDKNVTQSISGTFRGDYIVFP
jgi:hypothetical protein